MPQPAPLRRLEAHREGAFLRPEDGHAPMVGEGTVRKIIVKVRR